MASTEINNKTKVGFVYGATGEIAKQQGTQPNNQGNIYFTFEKPDDENGAIYVNGKKFSGGVEQKIKAGAGINIEQGENNTITIKSTIDTGLFVVLEDDTKIKSGTPDEGDENKIHLLKLKENTGDKDTYAEYIYVNGAWEKLGTLAPSIDLSGYAKTSEVESTYAKKTDLDAYTKEAELGGKIDAKLADYAKTSEVAETYATKASLDSYATKKSLEDAVLCWTKYEAPTE